MKMNEDSMWQNVISDCKRALELDEKNVKALFYLGSAYLALQNNQSKSNGIMGGNENNINRALTFLKKAYDLAWHDSSIGGSLIFEICQSYLKAKKAQWMLKDIKRRSDNESLYAYLKGLIECEQSSETRMARLNQLESLFENCSIERERRFEVPDAFIGKINFEIMTDPIITPSGVTFDRVEITEHLNKIGKFDPFTRQPLDFSQLIPNLALKETIDAFLEKNGWAVDF
jgi:STIP1 family protein 1